MNESRTNENIVHRILSGKLIFNLDNIIYELRKPSLDIKLDADLLYASTYEENIYSDFLSLEDLDSLLIQLDILYPDYQKNLSRLEKSLENTKVQLFQQFFDTTKRPKIKNRITNLKADIDSIYSKKHSLDFLTLEHYCDNIRHEYIVSNCLYFHKNKNLVFNDSNIDYTLFNSIISIITKNMIDVTTYKKIARCDYWKNYWSNNKTNILDEPVKEWSEEQKSLINISCMYDKIYEHPECPQEDVIQDDDALDGWMIYQKQENDKKKKEKGVDTILSDKMRNSSEVFLVASSREQAKDILDLNSDTSRDILTQRVGTVLSSESPVKHSQLADVKEQIRKQLQEKGK